MVRPGWGYPIPCEDARYYSDGNSIRQYVLVTEYYLCVIIIGVVITTWLEESQGLVTKPDFV